MISLRTRASIYVTLLGIIISAAGSWHFVSAQKHAIENEVIARGSALNLALQKSAEQGLVEENLGFIKKASYLVHAEDVVIAQVYTPLWQAMDAYPDDKFEEPADPEAIEHFNVSEELFVKKTRNSYDFYSLVKIKPFDDAPSIKIGYARLSLSTDAMKYAVGKAIVYNVIYSIVITLIAAASFNMLIQRRIIKPVIKLHDSVKMFRNGVVPENSPIRSGDEIGVLASEFYDMSLAIRDREERLQIEKDKVEEKNRLLIAAQEELVRKEKLEAVGILSAGVAHEINNPLANASLRIEIMKKKLEESGSDGEFLERLLAIERNVDRASAIAKELLEFSRERALEFLPVDVNDIVKSSLSSIEHRLGGVEINTALGEIPAVSGDSMKLEQVFINILSNAAEAMPSGGRISVCTSLDGGSVQVAICDTGSGISDEVMARVFVPFFTTKDVGAGTGLGLSICYGIITQHKGSIGISSVEGEGTTVIVKLPAINE